MQATIERINRLSAERARLYLEAANGQRGDRDVLARVHELDAELQGLWNVRRQEKARRRDVIDVLIDRAYEQTYGSRYEDAVAPPTVAEPVDAAA